MRSWEQRIQARVKQAHTMPPLDDAERITTTIAEILAADINYRLFQKNPIGIIYPPIDTHHFIDNRDLLSNIDRRSEAADNRAELGLYPFIFSTVCNEMLRQLQRPDAPFALLEAQTVALKSYAASLRDPQQRKIILQHFISRFPQLEAIGLGTTTALEEFVNNRSAELARDALQNKPSNPAPKPRNGGQER